MPRIHVVTSVEASKKAVHQILSECPVIGLACLGSETGSKGTIYLVVIATIDEDVYAFDVRKDPNIVLDGSLVRIIQTTDVIKVMHNCARDSAALHYRFGVTLRNVFDTQVAFRVLMEERGLPPRMISKSAIFNEFDIDGYAPSPGFQRLLREDVNVWARRPLNKDMLNTAAAEVVPLVTVIFEKLKGVLKPKSVDWFECLCDQHRKTMIKPKISPKGGNSSRSRKNEDYEMSIVAIKPQGAFNSVRFLKKKIFEKIFFLV